MATERVVFQQAVEGLLKVVPEEQLNSAVREELRRAGVDVHKPLHAAYPLSTWVQFSAVLAKALYPDISMAEAHRRLGHRLVEGFFQTFIGKALLAVLKLLGPKRALLRTHRNFRSANNYTEVTYEELGPNEFQMWMNEVDTVPEYTAGIVEAGLAATGAQAPVANVLRRDHTGCFFHVKWS